MNEDDKIVTFASYYDPMLAQIVRTRLEYNNISCFIADENIIWAKPYYNQLLGGVKIKIFEKDLEKCREILASVTDLHEQDFHQAGNETITDIVCSYCSSTNVRYGAATVFKFHLPSLLVSLLAGVPLYFRKAWHCFNCHRDF